MKKTIVIPAAFWAAAVAVSLAWNLKCHAAQGYQAGDVRGGISVAVPLAPLWVIGCLGLAGISWGARHIRGRAERLHESEERIRLLLDSTAEAIYGLDLQGICTFCNLACLRVLGYSDEADVLGKNMHDLIRHTRPDGTHYPVHECRIYEAFQKGEGTHVDDEVLWRANGSSFPAEYWSYPIRKNGDVIGSVVTFLDITGRRRIEENLRAAKADAEAANLAKSEFLANMSHEIRTPLTAILGFAEMLELDGDMEAAPKSRVDAVRTIRCNGDHLLQIIDDILDLSKMEKLGEIRTEPCNLRATIDHAIDSFRPLANPGVEFLVECPGSARAPVILHTSPVRLRQILLNLVGNAVKFTDEGFIKVAVAVGGRRLTIDVEDTGSGMEIGQAKELFAPFRQLDNSATRKHGGTGLGLAITRRLAERMHGSVEIVRAESNIGCTFRLTLPDVRGVQTQPEEELPEIPRGLRFLIMEDREDNSKLLGNMLTALGAADVAIAINGEQGIGMIADGKEYDIILMDMQMPVMDGWTAARLLRESGCVIPIVAVTASTMSSAKCLSAGCDSHASKPVSTKSLSAAIVKAMQHAEHTESRALAGALC